MNTQDDLNLIRKALQEVTNVLNYATKVLEDYLEDQQNQEESKSDKPKQPENES